MDEAASRVNVLTESGLGDEPAGQGQAKPGITGF
jgi:hypothetical protein